MKKMKWDNNKKMKIKEIQEINHVMRKQKENFKAMRKTEALQIRLTLKEKLLRN